MSMSSLTSESPGLVSIVMPAYNSCDVIGQAICSVLCQTYSNWELLITDDGSTDMTADVVLSFFDDRITLLRQPNQGVSAARNTAIDISRGEFITFLDADDALPPQSLESRVKLLQNDSTVDVVDGVLLVCGPDLNTILKRRRPGQRCSLLSGLINLDPSVFRGVCYLLRRKLIGSIRFRVGLTHAEDLLFFFEISDKHRPVFSPVSEDSYIYRTGYSSAMANVLGLEQGYLCVTKELSRLESINFSARFFLALKFSKILILTFLALNHPIRAIFACPRQLFALFSR